MSGENEAIQNESTARLGEDVSNEEKERDYPRIDTDKIVDQDRLDALEAIYNSNAEKIKTTSNRSMGKK